MTVAAGFALAVFTRETALLIDALGGAVIALLGVWVLLLRPSTAPTRALGTFCFFFGAAFLVQNGIDPDASSAFAWQVALIAVGCLACPAIFYLASVFPGPVSRREALWLWVCIAAVAIRSVAWSLSDHELLLPPGLTEGATGGVAIASDFLLTVLAASVAVVVLFLAVRSSFATEPAELRSYSILTAALILWPGYLVGAFIILQQAQLLFLSLLAILVAAGIVFIVQTRRHPNPRSSRNLALLCFAMPAIGMAAAFLWGAGGGFGATRLVMVLLLVYAIVRHHVLGIDAKIRFAISKSTVAGIFIAVFFVASEAAQQFFGAKLGGAYIGIAAAGGLVFAMAPLQRLGERLADKAVPQQGAVGTTAAVGSPSTNGMDRVARDGAREDLRFAYASAARDGRITRDEELALARLATRLGLDAATVMEIRHETMASQPAGARRKRR